MKPSAELDSFALCVSALAAPLVLALVGLVGAYSSKTGLLSLFFWQVVLAFEYAQFYLVISIPIAWSIWRWMPSLLASLLINFYSVAVVAVVFGLSANARAFGVRFIGPFETETISFILGLALNANAFVLMNRRALTLRSSGTPQKRGAP